MAACTETDFIEDVLEAARLHGEQSEPDMEVGDLQGLVRVLWAVLTNKQKLAFIQSADEYRDLIADWSDDDV